MKNCICLIFYLTVLTAQSQNKGCEYILSGGSSDAQIVEILNEIKDANCSIKVTGEISVKKKHTFKSNINLTFENGGFFTGTGELIVDTSIEAGLYKIFDVSNNLVLKGKPTTDRFFPQWFGAKINDEKPDNIPINSTINFANQAGGGTVFFPSGTYGISNSIVMKSNVVLEGEGDSSILLNTSEDKNSIDAIGTESNRIHGIGFKSLKIMGEDKIKYSGGIGINIAYSFNNEFDDNSRDFRVQRGDPISIFDVTILNHKEHGIYFFDGSLLVISNSTIENNKEYGVYVFELSNHLELNNCVIANNRKSGVYLNQVASNCTILGTQFTRNSQYGIVLQRCEQPVVSYNSFNNNFYGAINILGDENKYVDAPLIIGNLFGGNGIYAPGNIYEIDMNYTKGASIISNYFFGVSYINTLALINIGQNVKGAVITNNHWKELNSTTQKISFSGDDYFNQKVVFIDNNSTVSKQEIYHRNKFIEYVNDTKTNTVFQTRLLQTPDYISPNFKLENGGKLSWGGGLNSLDIDFQRVDNQFMNLSSGLQTQIISLMPTALDSVSKSTFEETIYGTIFLDASDNKLKVKLPDGIIKTIKFE